VTEIDAVVCRGVGKIFTIFDISHTNSVTVQDSHNDD